ncbi:hypothetical protein ABCS02_20980 [Microbacterium sp. X-17]|uniref:hypothetical protein n=1 Tax=Microbacterium sp. X-17 TaxID=3144404 RepID=UPI0031F570C2
MGAASTVDDVRRLRARLDEVEGRRMGAPVLPVHPELAALLPGGGLRAGSSYTVAPSASLLLGLLARPSREGAWCAVVGMPELGAEAAELAGVALDRLVLVPDPGSRWLAVTAALADVLPVVVVRPVGRVVGAEVARLSARLRDKGTVLVVQGAWPGVEASLEVGEAEWAGLGRGHGHLESRALTVTVRSRRSPAPRRARLLLPDARGDLDAAGARAGVAGSRPATTSEPMALPPVPLPLRAVG